MLTTAGARSRILWFPLILALLAFVPPSKSRAEVSPSLSPSPPPHAPVLSGAVADLEGKPLQAARVSLITKVPDSSTKSSTGKEAKPEPTPTLPPVPVSANGTFSLPISGPGPWWVRAEAPGFAPLTRKVKATGEPISFRLGPGGTIEGAAIAAADNRPITRAKVRLFGASLDLAPANNATTQSLAETRTDGRGRFRFSHLEPDHYRIQIEAEDFMSPLPFQVQVGTHGETREHDFYLLPGATLSGRVKTKTGRPVEGASVSAYPQYDQHYAAAKLVGGAPEPAVATTDREGTFTLTGLPAVGGFNLYVNHPGFAGAVVENIPLNRSRRVDSLEVTLFRGASLKVSLVQEFGGPFLGNSRFSIQYQKTNPVGPQFPVYIPQAAVTTVFEQIIATKIRPGKGHLTISPTGCRPVVKAGIDFEDEKQIDLGSIKVEPVPTVTGMVLNHAGLPVAQAKIRAVAAGSNTPGYIQTEKDGTFSFPAPQTGAEYSLTAIGPDDLTSEPVTAKADSFPVTLQIPAPGKITCRVFAGDPPVPLSAVTFSLYSPSSMDLFSRAASMAKGRTSWDLRGQDGEFVLEGLKPGHLPLEIKAEGFLPAHPEAVEITPLSTTDIGTIILRKALSVRGRIVEQGSSQPVGGARINLIRPDISPILAQAVGVFAPDPDAVSGRDGEFTLGGLRNGANTIRVSHSGFCMKTVEVQLQSGVPAPAMTITLEVGGTIEGTFLKDDGSPVSSGLIDVRSNQTDSVGRTETDNAGFFRLEHLPPGEYIIRGDPGHPTTFLTAKEVIARWRETKATVREGETTFVQLPGKPPIRVHGAVLREGTPLKGALACFSKARNGITTTTVDDNGQYELKLLAPGGYLVVFSQDTSGKKPDRAVSFDLEVSSAADQQFDLTVPTGVVAGRVSDGATGEPLQGIKIQLSPKPGTKPAPPFSGRTHTETGPDGSFRIEAVSEGTYLVQASRKGYIGQTAGPFKVFDGKEKDDLSLTLFPGNPVNATVVDEERIPVPAAWITELVPADSGRSRISVQTDGKGAAELNGLTDGLHDLVAYARGFAPAILHGVLIGPGAPEVVFILRPGFPLQVNVVDNLGTAVGAFQAFIRNPDGTDLTPFLGSPQPAAPAARQTEASGSVEFSSVPAGKFEIEVRAGGKSASQKVEVSGEGPRRVTIRLP